jgi:broad specificity phosphatase PhoE
VRHAQSTWNEEHRWQGQLDPPITERGIEQARRLGARLAGRKLAGFYSSDLRRARQTAEVVAQAVGREPVLDPLLREVALGAWQGKTSEDLACEFPVEWAAWNREPSWDLVPGGEGQEAFVRRVVRTFGSIFGTHPSGDILCVTHGGVIQVALASVVGSRSTRGNFPFVIRNASISVLQRSNGRTVVAAVNDTCHLG